MVAVTATLFALPLAVHVAVACGGGSGEMTGAARFMKC